MYVSNLAIGFPGGGAGWGGGEVSKSVCWKRRDGRALVTDSGYFQSNIQTPGRMIFSYETIFHFPIRLLDRKTDRCTLSELRLYIFANHRRQPLLHVLFSPLQ